jgi:hypothetical protein
MGWFAYALLWSFAAARPVAADVYGWNATGTNWTSPNAWNLNAANGPAATWVNGNDAVFAAGGSVAVSYPISVTSLVFNYFSQVTVPAAGGTLTNTSGLITVASTAGATINAPLGGTAVTVVRNTPGSITAILSLGGRTRSPAR